MALSVFQIKRWYKMLSGKSIDHVNQNIGKCFSTTEIKGYYNNLTEKVTKNPLLLHNDKLPKLTIENGEQVDFPVAIFQYGLGAYDMYQITKDKAYLQKFFQCVEWTMSHIDEKGRWNNFFFYSPNAPFSAMAQGEGASILIRAYQLTGDKQYLDKAKLAIDYMLLPIEEGGTSLYRDSDIFLMEYTFKGMVLNGAIFAWWGLYEYVKITSDHGYYNQMLRKTLDSLVNILHKFKCRYWSMYSLDGLIASPFYHNLHIAQMQAMFALTGIKIFEEYAVIWERQQNDKLCLTIGFIKKAFQKILE